MGPEQRIPRIVDDSPGLGSGGRQARQPAGGIRGLRPYLEPKAMPRATGDALAPRSDPAIDHVGGQPRQDLSTAAEQGEALAGAPLQFPGAYLGVFQSKNAGVGGF